MWDNGGRSIYQTDYIDYEDLILQRQEQIEIAEDHDDYCATAPDGICPYTSDVDCRICTYCDDIW